MYLYTAFKLQGNMLSEPRNWGLMAKAVFTHCESWIVASSNQKHALVIFLFIVTKTLVKYLSFMKETSFLPTLAGKSSDSTVSPDLDNNGYGSQQSQNTLLCHFSHGVVQCVLSVSLHNSEIARKHMLL